MDSHTLCLAVLLRGAASGYEIKKALEEPPFAHFQDTGFGSIYPALTRMAGEGLVDCTPLAQEKRPDKKVYAITEAGRRALVEALSVPPGPDRYRSDFLFVLFLGELLPRDYLAGVIDRRIADYREHLAHMAGCDLAACSAPQRLVHGFGLTVYQAAADYLEANRGALLEDSAAPQETAAE